MVEIIRLLGVYFTPVTYLSRYLQGPITPFKTIGLGPTWYDCYTYSDMIDQLSNHPLNHVIPFDKIAGGFVVICVYSILDGPMQRIFTYMETK